MINLSLFTKKLIIWFINDRPLVFTRLCWFLIVAVIHLFLICPEIRAQSINETKDSLKSLKIEVGEIKITGHKTGNTFQQPLRLVTVIEKARIINAPVHDITGLLEYITSIDIRQRGGEGVQADLSIRGSSADQVLILLNGINITDPQTGHHNLNLPVDISMIERIEVLEGSAALVYASNAFSGAINIITSELKANSARLNLVAGMHGFLGTGLSGGIRTGKFSHSISLNRKSSKGYIDNTDFEISNLFYNLLAPCNSGTIALQAGFNDKGFGANSFYTPKYPDQYENTRTIFGSFNYQSESKLHLNPLIYWRRHQDEFRLFRNDPPSWYKSDNFHLTNTFGMGISSWFMTGLGKTSFGVQYRNEHILSNVLGELLESSVDITGENADYTKSASRSIFSAFAGQLTEIGRFSLSGVLITFNENFNEQGFTSRFYPGVDLNLRMGKSWKLYSSFNKSVRLPSFTELYYSDPTHKGNSLLKAEKSSSAEAGLKLASKSLSGNISFFYRRGVNLIDWIREPGTEIWQTRNYTETGSRGIEMNIDLRMQELTGKDFLISNIRLGYLFNNMDKVEQEAISFYLLDYLKHKLNISLQHKIFQNFSASWELVYQDRNGSYTQFKENQYVGEVKFKPFWVLDGKIIYNHNRISVYISGNNLLNTHYFDYGNVRQPGTWLKSGFIWDIYIN